MPTPLWNGERALGCSSDGRVVNGCVFKSTVFAMRGGCDSRVGRSKKPSRRGWVGNVPIFTPDPTPAAPASGLDFLHSRQFLDFPSQSLSRDVEASLDRADGGFQLVGDLQDGLAIQVERLQRLAVHLAEPA